MKVYFMTDPKMQGVFMSGNDYAQARKAYVEEVRRSFQHDDPDHYDEGPYAGEASFFKVRLLIAVCIFAAFILCDRTGSRFYNYTTNEVVSMLQEEKFQTQLESIRKAWNMLRTCKEKNEVTDKQEIPAGEKERIL